MEKIISRLAIFFCFAPILLFPRISFAASVDLKVIVNAANGDGVFNFSEADAVSGRGVPEVDFSVSTQNGNGEFQVTLPNPYFQFNIGQTLPDGWRQIGVNCVDSATSTEFMYYGTGNVGVTLNGGENHIVCTYNDQYSDEWSTVSYLNINATTVGGDGNFTYTVLSNDGSNTDPIDYQIDTTNGHGFVSVPPRPFEFTIHQNNKDGWDPVSVFCQDTRNHSAFSTYVNYGWSAVVIDASGTYNITCTFANQKIAPAKTPVLFVPGLLGTDIMRGNELLWADPLRMINPTDSDSFMDSLTFNNDLIASDNTATYSNVIGKKIFQLGNNQIELFNYTEGLINEFKNQGYVTDEGASGQNFFTFPYDWRYGASGVYPDGATTNTTLLRDKINQILTQTGAQKVDVIAHSLGGLIVKEYLFDNSDPKINKLVFVGVPNLGSPVAAKTLLNGHDFNIFGLNPDEIKKISLNMPAAYDLLPSQSYYNVDGSFLDVLDSVSPQGIAYFKPMDYQEAQNYFSTYLNNQALVNGRALHSGIFDSYDVNSNGVDAYNIVGCKTGTIKAAFGLPDGAVIDHLPFDYISGDDTVPFESADSIHTDAGKTFYAQKSEHGQMPSQDGIRQTIVNIITGSSLDQGAKILPYQTVKQNPSLCELDGEIIEIHSPLDITVTDGQNNILGIDSDGNIRRDIPGASFEIENGHKYVYLPTGDGETYNISLQGTGSGIYTLIDEKIVNGQPVGAQIFKDQPVTPSFSGNLDIAGTITTISTGDGEQIKPSFQVQGNALQDMVAPTTSATIGGLAGQPGFYRGSVTVNLSATDLAQSGISAAGIASINYTLDNNATSTVADSIVSVKVSDEGKHTITYFAQDKVGNREAQKNLNFTIDKTAPEIVFSFDQNKKDLAFASSDLLSGPGTVSDQGNAVIVSDAAGNNTQLGFVEKNRAQSLRAQISGLSYNGKAVNIGNNQLAFSWFYGFTPVMPAALSGTVSLPAIPAAYTKGNTLTFLLQQAKLKDGSFVTAIYSGKNTMILEYKNKKMKLQTVTGLKLLKFATNAGSFSWSY